MSVTWGSRPESTRSSSNPQSVTLGFVLTGTTDRTIAQVLASAYSSTLYGSLYRTNIALGHLGGDVWNVDVTYGAYERKEKEVGDSQWSFSTAGATEHITQAREHMFEVVKLGQVAVDHQGTIGINENGDVEGTEIAIPRFEWSEEHSLLLADHGWEFARLLADLTGTLNEEPFRGFLALSVLFLGADGRRSAKNPLFLDVTFRFEYHPHLADQTIGDITGITKLGWEYLWVEYSTMDPGAGAVHLAKRPHQVNVERVYEPADFSLLGIGVDAL